MRRSSNHSHYTLVSTPRPPLAHSISFPCSRQPPNPDLTSFLIQRQQLFRDAALQRKQAGDVHNAKKYLLQSKGFDLMISAACSGYPVTLSGVPPLPPLLSNDFAPETPIGSDFYNVECELLNQHRICADLVEHFLRADKVGPLLEVHQLGMNCAGDLEKLRKAYEAGEEVPPSEYTLMALPAVQVCRDVGSREIEIKVTKAFNLKVSKKPFFPKSYYINIYYPFPAGKGALAQTAKFTGGRTSNIDFSTRFIFSRHSLALKDRIKSETIKLDVFRQSFLKKSKFIGRAELKLDALGSSCTLHEILDVKKPVFTDYGRKLEKSGFEDRCSMIEVAARIRYPLGSHEENSTEIKWLVLQG